MIIFLICSKSMTIIQNITNACCTGRRCICIRHLSKSTSKKSCHPCEPRIGDNVTPRGCLYLSIWDPFIQIPNLLSHAISDSLRRSTSFPLLHVQRLCIRTNIGGCRRHQVRRAPTRECRIFFLNIILQLYTLFYYI